MAQICFSQTNFYLYILTALLVMGFSLYQVYQSQNELRDQQISDLSKQVEQLLGGGTGNVSGGNGLVLPAAGSVPVHTNPSIPIAVGGGDGEATLHMQDQERLNNPLVPPYRRSDYEIDYFDSIRIPINIPSRGEYGGFQVVGYLYQEDDPEKMIRLFGRRIHTDRYEYYTTNHLDPYLKIPLYVKNDQQLDTGDDIFVPGYKMKFKVIIYDLAAPRYIPY